MLEAEDVVGVEDVFGGPVSVVEVAPGGEVVVLDDEPAEVVLFGGFADVFDLLFEFELGGVNSEDGEPVVFVALMPCPQGRPRVLAVVSGVCPEVDQDDLTGILELLYRGGFAVQPFLSVSEGVIGAFV